MPTQNSMDVHDEVAQMIGAHQPTFPLRRHQRRGMMLIVVLGVLTVLSLIGVFFGYTVIHEHRASRNALNRFLAMSAARDGEAYAIARLRSYALVRHYEGEGEWSFNTRVDRNGSRLGPNNQTEDYYAYLKRYAANPTLQSSDGDVIPSFSKFGSTSTSNVPDANWVDSNGNGAIEDNEKLLARDLFEAEFRSPIFGISYFVGDGIDMRAKAGDNSRPPQFTYRGGTSRDLGDRARLKVIDTNAQLNINDYSGEELIYKLMVLGREIAVISGDERHNPFPEDIAEAISAYKQDNLGVSSKDDLRMFFEDEALYQFTMDFIAVASFPTGSGAGGTQPLFIRDRNPDLFNNQLLDPNAPPNPNPPQPFRNNLGGPDRDGFPELQPEGGRSQNLRSPININTVSKPVLTAMLAGIEAEPRFLYFAAADKVLQPDQWLKGAVDRLAYGTTDAGMQPIRSGPGLEIWGLPGDPGTGNFSPYQVVPVGPIGYPITPRWRRVTDNRMRNPWAGNHASTLAQIILDERERNGPFRSWMDFDYRICHQRLLGFAAGATINNPDLVNTKRTIFGTPLPGALAAYPKGDGDGPNDLLPDPGNVTHPASGRNASSAHSYNAQEFDAWYWRASVDMLRAALNPNGYLNKSNPDAAAYTTVDSTDLVYTSAPICFSSMGTYEIVSQGEIAAMRVGGATPTATSRRPNVPHSQFTSGSEAILARRTMRTIAQVYNVYQHTTQSDFLRTRDPRAFTPSFAATETLLPAYVAHDVLGTMTHPNSIDHAFYESRDQLTGQHRVGDPTGLVDRQRATRVYGGYFGLSAADDRFGYVSLYPQDRTPLRATQPREHLNLHGPYNFSLDLVDGLDFGCQDPLGHAPLSRTSGVVGYDKLQDSLNSASPDPARQDVGPDWTGFSARAERNSPQAARYATLRPDGALLRSWSSNPAFVPGGGMSRHKTYGKRGGQRISRLALLRYRNGVVGEVPLSPVGTRSGTAHGPNTNPDDQLQVEPGGGTGNAAPYIRLFGDKSNDPNKPGNNSGQGTDAHNIDVQYLRQYFTNLPYYEGWVDFWIKWDLPPQGESRAVTCAGDIDPGSGNFSGLLGATSYGRFGGGVSATSAIAYDSLGSDTDFEGTQFFIFKEPGGVLRVTQLYFTRAYSAQSRDMTSIASGYRIIGNDNRIKGKSDLDEFVGTNDICSNVQDLGFSFARTDSYAILHEHKVPLLTHNWYRFSLSYRSNARHDGVLQHHSPHRLFIDGKEIPLVFEEPTRARDGEGGVNTGEVTRIDGTPTLVDWDNPEQVMVQRSSTHLLEVDPEDQLTIGGIFRRQRPDVLAEAIRDANILPVFLFDSNLIAPANATLDDVRITHRLDATFGADGSYGEGEYAAASRYERHVERSREALYENGFFATVQSGTDSLFPFPVRVGTLSWTEYRPNWDPYTGQRLDLTAADGADAPHIVMNFDLFDDAITSQPGGLAAFASSNFDATTPGDGYWLEGGMALNRYGNNRLYLRNRVDVSGVRAAMLKYQAFFVSGSRVKVMNVSPILDDVRLSVLAPPRRLKSEEIR